MIIYTVIVYPIELLIEVLFDMSLRVFRSPGPAIVGVSLIVNLLTFPLYKRSDNIQEEEREKRKIIEPWVNHIKESFHGDERTMMLSTLYRKNGYSPIQAVRGSFSLLLQIPFFIAAFHFLSRLDILQGASFLFLPDLGKEDQLIHLFGYSINLMPIIMTLINILSGIIYTKGFPLKDKIQLYLLAGFFLIFLYHSPSGLVLYWTLNNLFSLAKSIFIKLIPDPAKWVCGILSLLSIISFSVLLASGRLYTTKRFLFMLVVLIGMQVPGLVLLLRRKRKKTDTKLVNSVNKMRDYYLWAGVLVVLIGLLIPSAVISTSPEEFYNVSKDEMPYNLIFYTFCLASGYLLVWGGIIVYMFGGKIKGIIEPGMAILACVASVDYLVFGKNLGYISSLLVFDKEISYPLQDMILDSMLICVLVFLILYTYIKHRSYIRYAGLVLISTFIVVFSINMVKIHTVISSLNYTAATADNLNDKTTTNDDDKIIHLSTNGENVIIIMLDRFVSGYIPYILEEKPVLRKQLSGFTFFPNTTSLGYSTFTSASSLFGGYEYSPVEINKRKDELLASCIIQSVDNR